MAAQPGRRVDRRIPQPLQVPALHQEDVIDERANGRKPPARLHLDLERLGPRREPRAPLVALFLGVALQLGEINLHHHLITAHGFSTRLTKITKTTKPFVIFAILVTFVKKAVGAFT